MKLTRLIIHTAKSPILMLPLSRPMFLKSNCSANNSRLKAGIPKVSIMLIWYQIGWKGPPQSGPMNSNPGNTSRSLPILMSMNEPMIKLTVSAIISATVVTRMMTPKSFPRILAIRLSNFPSAENNFEISSPRKAKNPLAPCFAFSPHPWSLRFWSHLLHFHNPCERSLRYCWRSLPCPSSLAFEPLFLP